jgi:hypothetical protein
MIRDQRIVVIERSQFLMLKFKNSTIDSFVQSKLIDADVEISKFTGEQFYGGIFYSEGATSLNLSNVMISSTTKAGNISSSFLYLVPKEAENKDANIRIPNASVQYEKPLFNIDRTNFSASQLTFEGVNISLLQIEAF